MCLFCRYLKYGTKGDDKDFFEFHVVRIPGKCGRKNELFPLSYMQIYCHCISSVAIKEWSSDCETEETWMMAVMQDPANPRELRRIVSPL